MNTISRLCLAAATLVVGGGIYANAQISVQAGATIPYQRLTQFDPLALKIISGLGICVELYHDILKTTQSTSHRLPKK